MQMKLRHEIADGGDVELFGPVEAGEQPPRRRGLFHQSGAIVRIEIEDFAEPRALRHEDQPGPALLVHQENQRQLPARHLDRVGLEARVELERLFHPDFPTNSALAWPLPAA
jgi:hypothetical protein